MKADVSQLVRSAGFVLGLLLCFCSEKRMESLLLAGAPEVPTVLASHPSANMLGVTHGPLWVLFDRQMDREKTQAAFRLSGGRVAATGSFYWEANKLFFLPREQLPGGEAVLLVGRDAESSTGADLAEDYVVRFFTNADQTLPDLIRATPAHGAQNVAADVSIVLTFSKPIALASMDEGISITPTFIHSVTPNADRTVLTITPASPLAAGSYTVTLTALQDDAGNRLAVDRDIRFTVGNDFTGPSITAAAAGGVTLADGILTTGVERGDPLELRFSESMERATVEAALSLSPATGSLKVWNAASDRLQLFITGGLESETEYALAIADSATDPAGNSLNSAYLFRFRTDGPLSRRPQVLTIRQGHALPVGGVDGAAGTGSYGAVLTDFSPLDLTHLIDIDSGPGGDFAVQLRVDFSVTMAQASLAQAMQFTPVLDNSAGQVQVHDIQILGAAAIVTLHGSPFPTGPGTPLYRLRIAGSAEDVNGNKLGSAHTLYLTF